jgi:cytochrome c553
VGLYRWLTAIAILLSGVSIASVSDPEIAAQELEKAIDLIPDVERGRVIYLMCAVCHQPEGWGTADGEYPQIAGQLYEVTIKQLADIRARNRDTPTMYPFTKLEFLNLQQIADVAGYLSQLPMNPNNSVGPGTDLEKGEQLYGDYCAECHGEQGEGIAAEHMPLIQGQHYPCLVRQFEWIADGKRRNADPEMVEQIQGFSADDVSAIMDYTSRLSPPRERLGEPDWQNPDFAEFVRDPQQQSSNNAPL